MDSFKIRREVGNRAETWKFVLFQNEVFLVLREYFVEERESKRHKWKIVGWYDYTNLRDCGIKKPPLPNEVREEAFKMLVSKIQIGFFEDWKKKYG